MSKDIIIEYFNSLPEVKRIKELEPFIDNNKKIQDQFERVKASQRAYVLKKESKQDFSLELDLYNKEKEKLFDMPFVEEYLELIDIVHEMLNDLTSIIENQLYKKINGWEITRFTIDLFRFLIFYMIHQRIYQIQIKP